MICSCFSISNCAGIAADDNPTPGSNKFAVIDEEPKDVDAVNDSVVDIRVGSGDNEYYYHGFTREEIERNRIVTIHHDGSETISTYEEVAKTLEYVRESMSTNFLHEEPHFTVQEEKRTVIGADNRFSRNQNRAPYSAMGYLGLNISGRSFRCSCSIHGWTTTTDHCSTLSTSSR